MKYEMIFGDERLFNCAPEDCVIAIIRPYIKGERGEELYFFKSAFDAIVKAGSDFNFNNVIMRDCDFAMRRIIKTPVWTKADRAAGKLPEVGCKVRISPTDDATILGYDNEQKVFAVQCDSGAFDILKITEMLPIETPEERAKREEDEWVELAFDNMMRNEGLHSTEDLDRIKRHFRSIYKAQQSGELKMPEVQK